jgi:hypothetical protein
MLKKILETLETKLQGELKGYSELKLLKDRELDQKFAQQSAQRSRLQALALYDDTKIEDVRLLILISIS